MNRAVDHNRTPDIVKQLTSALHHLAKSKHVGTEETHTVHRLELDLATLDPLLWLAAQPGEPKFYWRDRDGHQQISCLGAAATIFTDLPDGTAQTLDKAAVILRHADTNAWLYGSFRFDPHYPQDKRDSRWHSFGAAWLMLPRFELVTNKDSSRMYCNILRKEIGTAALNRVSSKLRELRFDEPEIDIRLPGLVERTDMPERTQWDRQVAQAVDLFRRADLKKLVLARQTSLRLNAPVNPWHVLYRLRESAANCYLFGVQTGDSGVFVGASPERLYRREGDSIETEAVAGTRPRAQDRREDVRLAHELTTSDKDRFEHDLVVSGIQEALAKTCQRFDTKSSATPIKLSAVQHLRTLFKGRLKPDVDDATILSALHPSPAVGGYPRTQAMTHLREIESLDRGWYAGPTGWLSESSAEFAVGIRSALVHDNFIDLFAGAGVVGGSSADAEWNEIESKMSPYLQLFERAES
jgi:menaquinone-specific isochorismate synthase